MSAESLKTSEAPRGTERTWDWFDYHSVFSYRYARKPMRRIWSEGHKTELMADVWIAVASAQHHAGLVSDEEIQDLVDHKPDFVASIDEVLSREMDTANPNYVGHDIVAAISVYREKAPIGGRVLHRPMTAEDLLSNVEVLQMVEGVNNIDQSMRSVLGKFAEKIDKYKDLPALGLTHMKAAEPLTLGLRFAVLAQNFLMDFKKLQQLKDRIYGKGIKGPVGTSAEVEALLEGTDMTVEEHEELIMDDIGLKAFPVTTQTYPRKLTADVIGVLADIGVSATNFGMNMRFYQSSLVDELAEPRDPRDRGSSAMPHKRNPRHSENIMALGRRAKFCHMEAQEVAQDVPAERGIDDSAGKRTYLPEAFLAIDEALKRVEGIVDGVEVHETSIWRNLHNFASFITTAPILAMVTKEGADRHVMHNKLFDIAMQAYDSLQRCGINNFDELLLNDERIKEFITEEQIKETLEKAETHIGPAPRICENFVANHLNPAIEQVAA